jgi:hypothetical protein
VPYPGEKLESMKSRVRLELISGEPENPAALVFSRDGR